MRNSSSAWMRAGAAIFVVGWGANMFAPLLQLYRGSLGSVAVAEIFLAYIIGLIPALLLAPRVSDRVGRRAVVRFALVLALVGSLVLLLAGTSFAVLAIGRIVVGVAAGAAFAPGTTWVRELSAAGGHPEAGARRAALSLSAGFGAGPLVTGILAQWLPAPDVLPYAVHIVMVLLVGAIAWNADEPGLARDLAPSDDPARGIGTVLRGRVFLAVIVTTAPWVFGAPAAAFATLPGLLPIGHLALVVSGVTAAITLATGILVQGWGRRLAARSDRAPFVVGLLALVVGMLLAALAVTTQSEWLLAPTAIALGAAYGLLLVSGLSTVGTLASPSDQALLSGIFYSITYVGFAYPLLMSVLAPVLGAPLVFVLSAAVGALALLGVRAGFRA